MGGRLTGGAGAVALEMIRGSIRMIRSLVVSLLLLASIVNVPPVTAQETEATPASSAYLPDATALGTGWSELDRFGLEVPTDIFQEGSRASYTGPDGSRVVIAVYLPTEDRVAIRQSWEETTDTFDSLRYRVAGNYDYSQIDRLEALTPPDGCVEAKRAEGTDESYGVIAGLTMCALENDAILLAVASGSVLDESGYRAADAVIQLAISAASE